MQIYLIVRELKLRIMLKEFPVQNNYIRLCFLRVAIQGCILSCHSTGWMYSCRAGYLDIINLGLREFWNLRRNERGMSQPHFSFSWPPEHLQQHICWNPCTYGVVAKPKDFETYFSFKFFFCSWRRVWEEGDSGWCMKTGNNW